MNDTQPIQSNTPIRAIIVDDEPLARDGLSLLLEEEADIHVEAQCANGEEAIAAITSKKPDVLFLDIEMPGMNGFDVIREIGLQHMPQVIFVTAYNQYAVEAFEFHAMDYLLKPLRKDRLQSSLRRLRQQLEQADTSESSNKLNSILELFKQLPGANGNDNADRIIVKSHGHIHFLNASEIFWVEASGDYVTIHTAEKSHLLRETMHNMEKRLEPHGFKRIHRSSIINLDFVSELKTGKNNDYQVVLKDGTELNLGRSFKDALYSSLQSPE